MYKQSNSKKVFSKCFVDFLSLFFHLRQKVTRDRGQGGGEEKCVGII